MDLLGDLTLDDCNADKLLFAPGEVVEFVGIDHRVDEKKGHIFIKAKVLTGEHTNKEHTLMIAGGDSEMAKKQRARFFFRSGFWSQEEINAKRVGLAKVVGQRFSAKASKIREVDGEKYQNLNDIRYIGPLHQVQQVVTANPGPVLQTTPANVQAPPQQPSGAPVQSAAIATQY